MKWSGRRHRFLRYVVARVATDALHYQIEIVESAEATQAGSKSVRQRDREKEGAQSAGAFVYILEEGEGKIEL